MAPVIVGGEVDVAVPGGAVALEEVLDAAVGGDAGWVLVADEGDAGGGLDRRLPRWLFRLAAPYVASFAVDTSMRVANAKAKAELGWRPAFPSYRDGIAAMVGG